MTPTPDETIALSLASVHGYTRDIIARLYDAREAASNMPQTGLMLRDCTMLAVDLKQLIERVQREPVVAKERAAAGGLTQP